MGERPAVGSVTPFSLFVRVECLLRTIVGAQLITNTAKRQLRQYLGSFRCGGDTASRNLKIRPLEVHELNKAENIVLKWVQQDGFQQELQCLRNNRNLPKKSKLASLCPFVDKNGLMRVGGRLRHASIPESQKHPIILPGKHHVSSLIMQENHKKLLHCSPEQLLHHTRQRYWPINGRRLAKGTVKSCLQCFRYRPAMPNALMGDLPKERVTIALGLSQ